MRNGLLIGVATMVMACQQAPLPGKGKAPKVAAGSATESLDRMDGRKPVPLLPMMAHHQKENMRDHLVAVQEIVQALAREDYAGVEKSAARIGYSDHMGMMCDHMGAAAPGFTDQAIAFHKTADGVGEAARKKDRGGVLTSLGQTLTSCTACHAAWKQQVVDEATYQRLSATHGAHK
ncbi:MAG: hypothetical protein AB2A00_22320 [Myxococcota bacterium]